MEELLIQIIEQQKKMNANLEVLAATQLSLIATTIARDAGFNLNAATMKEFIEMAADALSTAHIQEAVARASKG